MVGLQPDNIFNLTSASSVRVAAQNQMTGTGLLFYGLTSGGGKNRFQI
jgi:hypothetical protein